VVVYLLWHSYETDVGADETKLIGVYSTSELAQAAQKRAATLPGFCDRPNAFEISAYELDKDDWREGYVTLSGLA
jgi:hypothetical protein